MDHVGSPLDESGDPTLSEGGVHGLPVSESGKAGRRCQDGCQGQHALAYGTKVTHETGIGFLVELLGSRARRDQAMEAGNGTTGKDRKSTRLNSSHVRISYAVFCLKKKKKKN